MQRIITTASNTDQKPLLQHRFICLLFAIFFTYWMYGWLTCLNVEDWIIENLLVVICISLVIASHKWHRLSEFSYLCLFVFVMLHLYGAFYAYTRNNLGEWLRDTYHLARNPYDRIVHFSFGLLLAYPIREILVNKYKLTGNASWWMPIQFVFSLGTIFELIEWGVATFTDTETGETYVATQGDVWDAHKDIILALIGTTISMTILYGIKRGYFTHRSKNLVLPK